MMFGGIVPDKSYKITLFNTDTMTRSEWEPREDATLSEALIEASNVAHRLVAEFRKKQKKNQSGTSK